MKSTLLACALLVTAVIVSASGFSGFRELSTAEKIVSLDGVKYIVSYVYDPMSCSFPAVMGNQQPHYSAQITVWRDDGDVRIKLWTGNGTYVPSGCFEDVPIEWVKKAIAPPKKEER